MATIKLEILLDTKDQMDILAFSNLMNAFSGTPSVQLKSAEDKNFPLEALKKAIEVQSLTTQGTPGAESVIIEASKDFNKIERTFTEDEMMAMPNPDLKEYVTGLNIDWAKAEGKNTNRKLANLVLESRNGETKDQESTTEEDEKVSMDTSDDLTKEDDLVGEEITYNDLKVSLGKKVDEHRDAIVAKLEEYGATKMTNLAEEHWTDMFNFMEAL